MGKGKKKGAAKGNTQASAAVGGERAAWRAARLSNCR
eukprot:SAG22_NODE_9529_length_585_cov_0.473251_1_plen_36_part_01